MFDEDIKNQALKIISILRNNNLKISCAESCTGGLLSALLTDIPGASKIFDRGFITYCNQAKIDLLQVKLSTLEKHGAVSKETAKEMAIGAIKNSSSQISVAITGISGPGGGSKKKPVGLVYIAYCKADLKMVVKKFNFLGDRSKIRMTSVKQVMSDLEQIIKPSK